MMRKAVPIPVPVVPGPEQTSIERECAACKIRTTETVIVPGTGAEIPPFVCVDFKACCLRYRKGLSPKVFAAAINWPRYV